jgi:capsular polysaccharide biosynthesis protein
MAQLTEVQRETEIRQREREWVQSEIKKYNQRVESTPRREQEMASLLRAYAELQKQYQDLKHKEVESKLAESLESLQKGTQFVVLDPANYPTRPDKPDRLRLVLMGLFFSLGLGGGLAVAVDFLGQKFWLHSEIEALLGIPLLVEIPEIVTEEDLRERRKRRLKYGLLFVVVLECWWVEPTRS